MPLRFIAQATWGGPKPSPAYAGFEALAKKIGHAPGWSDTDRTPVADGTYRLTAGDHKALAPAAGSDVVFGKDASAAWTLKATADGYYTLESAATGQCLEDNRGELHTGAPLDVGSEISVNTCSADSRTQRWQLERTAGGLLVRNAISQLAIGERASDGAAVQALRGQTFATVS